MTQPPDATVVLSFKDCELNGARFELRRSGAVVDIEPKALRLLLYLARERAQTCAKDDILAELWPDTIVSDDALFSVLKKARRAVGDDAASQSIIQTVRGRGYRFVASVEERDESASTTPVSPSVPFVGRADTLERLRSAIESMLAGSGRLILLEGEAGVGKTSMAEELATLACARGVEVHNAWAWQGGGAPAFWLWVQILRSCINDLAADGLRACLGAGAVDIAQVVPELRDVLSDVPEPIHEALSTTRRATIHRGIGEALEELHEGDLSEYLTALAYHFGEAAPLLDGSQAVDYAKLAGDQARERLSYEQAAELFDSASRAFELMGNPDPVRRAELWISQAGALFSAGETERAQTIFHKAAIIARGGNAPELLAAAAIGFAGIGVGVADEEAVELLEEALAGLGEADSFVRLWTLSTLVVHLANFPAERDRVESLVERNIEMARSIGDPLSLGFALVSKFAPERVAATKAVEERIACVTEAAQLGERVGYALLTANAREQLLGGLLEIGDIAAVDVEFDRLARALEQLRAPRWSWIPPGYQAMRQLLEGRYEDAEKSANEAYVPREASRSSPDPASQMGVIFALRREQGRLGELIGAS